MDLKSLCQPWAISVDTVPCAITAPRRLQSNCDRGVRQQRHAPDSMAEPSSVVLALVKRVLIFDKAKQIQIDRFVCGMRKNIVANCIRVSLSYLIWAKKRYIGYKIAAKCARKCRLYIVGASYRVAIAHNRVGCWRLTKILQRGRNYPAAWLASLKMLECYIVSPHDIRTVSGIKRTRGQFVCYAAFSYLLMGQERVYAYSYECNGSNPEHWWIFWGPFMVGLGICAIGHGWYRLCCTLDGTWLNDGKAVILGIVSISVGLVPFYWGLDVLTTPARLSMFPHGL